MNILLSKYYQTGTRIVWHAMFWVVLVLYHSIIYSMYSGDFGSELMWEGVALPVKMGATYLTLYLFLPRYFMNRRFVRFTIWTIVALLLAAFLQRLLEYTIVNQFINPYERAEVLLNPVKVLRAVIGIYPVVALAAFIKVGKHWYERDLESQKLQRDKLEAELKFLKAQINPHFLFNTLNNLYSLTLKQSKRASQVVLKLSNMLNYMLYDGSQSTVALEKELEAVETYISLEKLRYGHRLDLHFEIEGSTANKQIPPMLILPFVENSFKHGAGQQLNDAWINIHIKVEGSGFQLRVQNSLESGPESQKTDERNGIGLSNVRRRLDLLYGEKYSLDINREQNYYEIMLSLDLETQRTPKPEPT